MGTSRTTLLFVLLVFLAVLVIFCVRTVTEQRAGHEAEDPADPIDSLVSSIEFAVKSPVQIEALERARPRVVEHLARQLDADDTQLKMLARETWQRLPEEIRSRLGQMRQPPELRRAAIWGLVLTFERTNATPSEANLLWPVLRGALWDPDVLVRANAAWLASAFDPSDNRALELCRSAIADPSFLVRESAARSLGRIVVSRTEATVLLEKLVRDTNAVVRDTAELQLRFLGGMDRAKGLNPAVSSDALE